MIRYEKKIDDINSRMLGGFFEGWPKHPSNRKLLQILINSEHIVIALDKNRVVGFVNAISDNVLCAYIPLLEVLPAYRNKGVGKKLMGMMMKDLGRYYMVDIVCDKSLNGFYEKFGLKKYNSMIKRIYRNQKGKSCRTNQL